MRRKAYDPWRMYRNDLEAAHRRIEELETLLGQRRPPPPRRRGVAVVLVFLALGVLTSVGMFLVVATGRDEMAPAPVAVAASAPAPPTAPDVGSLSHDPADSLLSFFTPDVDGDGEEDVVAAFREPGIASPRGPLYVRAVSGATFKPIWTAGPFGPPSPGNEVAVVGGTVVVTVADLVTVLALNDGRVLHKLKAPAVSVCPARGQEGMALLSGPSASGSAEYSLLDPQTGVVSARPSGTICDYLTNECQVSDEPCIANSLNFPGLTVHARVHGWTTLVDGNRRVSYGYLLTPDASRDHMVVAGGTKPGVKATWERPATLEDEPIEEIRNVTNAQGMMADLHGDRFVLAYGVDRGFAEGVRVVARDADTGKLRWDAWLRGLPANAALRGTSARVYVLAGTVIHVLDGKTGDVRGVIGD